MLRDFDFHGSFAYRLQFPRKMGAVIAAILCLAPMLSRPTGAAQILLEPMTIGTFSWDWFGAPVNLGAGFDKLTTMTAGAYQKGTFTRNYRSYMIFDTLDSQSSILSATLDLTVTRRTTVSLTNPFSTLELTLGLPREFTAEEIADPQFAAQAPAGAQIFADLATNGFRTVSVPFGDVIQSPLSGDVLISTPLPLSFIAAFNQARSSSRYLTVSIFGGDYGMFSADFAVQPRLLVNNLTPVPEPLGWLCLSIGLGTLAIGRTLRAASRARTQPADGSART